MKGRHARPDRGPWLEERRRLEVVAAQYGLAPREPDDGERRSHCLTDAIEHERERAEVLGACGSDGDEGARDRNEQGSKVLAVRSLADQTARSECGAEVQSAERGEPSNHEPRSRS